VAKGVTQDEIPALRQLADDALEFARFTLGVFKTIVLANEKYVSLITSEDFTHRTYSMGLVDAKNRVNFYDGMVRVTDPSGKEFAKFAPAKYLDVIAEHVEPWSYVKFCYLKQVGWKGFVDGAESGIYSVAPLARLNTSDGMATPEAQKAYEELVATLGGKPVHHTLANHWARVVEMIQAAEKLREIANDPLLTGKRSGRSPRKNPLSGWGLWKRPAARSSITTRRMSGG